MTRDQGHPSEPLDSRTVTWWREQAEIALVAYAKTLRSWNFPDDEHTRYQLRGMVEDVIKEAVDAR